MSKVAAASALALLLCQHAAMANTAPVSTRWTSVSGQVPPPPPPPPIGGDSQSNPIMPSSITWWTPSSSGQAVGPKRYVFSFGALVSGLWYDPPMVEGFTIELATGNFASVTAPTGFSSLQLVVGGTVVDSSFDAGETYSFAAGVRSFDIRNIQPALDPDAPDFARALPLKLNFANSATGMVWTSLPLAVPESDIYLLMALGLGTLGLTIGRRRRG